MVSKVSIAPKQCKDLSYFIIRKIVDRGGNVVVLGRL
jgi:hypothetical protein